MIAVQGGGRRGCCGWGGVKGSREVWEGVRVIKKVKGLGWGRAHIQGPLYAREGKERRGEGKERGREGKRYFT